MGSYREQDTIAAEATPRGRGGISVVRVSGVNARSIVQQIFDRPLPESSTFKFGKLYASDGSPIDEAVVSLYGTPHSFTGEDVVELSTHGSPVIVAELLDALYRLGARPAEPGEFTYRAYLNGRIDLTQAEAIGDLIAASSMQSARQALKQLNGVIGGTADRIASMLERLMVYSEVELDFSEEDVELIPVQEKIAIADDTIRLAEEMIKGYQSARRLREGVKVALKGAPNVGKSSLFNALIGESRAIVHHQAGTTRDVVSAKTVIGGIEFEFFDTAGIRDGAGEVEDEGIRRAIETAAKADVILSIDSVDNPAETADSENTICVRNKSDLPFNTTSTRILVSASTGHGIEQLKDRLLSQVLGEETIGELTVTRERHFRLVIRAIEALRRGRDDLLLGITPEMVAEEWREALSAFDELTGKRRLDEILNTIFGQFCIGK